jgi:hypothetical protein
MKGIKIKKKILNHAKSQGVIANDKGYVSKIGENIIESINNWELIKAELNNGQGSELKADSNGIVKFNAIHSSSALCVNCFSIFKEYVSKLTFLNYNNFHLAEF